MKYLILCAIVAIARATVLVAPAAGILETGASVQHRNQDAFGNYNFGYNEDHTTGGTFRREAGDVLGNKVGSYGLRDADGRLRIVSYVADAAGFRANIQTNEPGTEPKDPAATLINKGVAAVPAVAAPIAPAVAYAATPVVAHAAAAAPLLNYGFYTGHVAAPYW
ncbi:cuticle protein 14-like [Centruroides vittatus]|uniref:cuticle protein 14-like n=1 Tax=Centruroides vittatus TaxID=120091 RepID=UPI00350EA214